MYVTDYCGVNIDMMNQTDIDYIAGLLNSAIKNRDWDIITEIHEYVQEFQDDPVYEEE